MHAILTHGLRAKTNFSYTRSHVISILEKEMEILSNDHGEDDDPTNEENERTSIEIPRNRQPKTESASSSIEGTVENKNGHSSSSGTACESILHEGEAQA